MKNKIVGLLLCVCLCMGLTGCGQEKEEKDKNGSDNSTEKLTEPETNQIPSTEENVDIFAGIATAANGARVSVHDPSIKVYDGTYYIYGSHMTGAYSQDMQSWTYIGNSYNSDNALFEDLFAEGLGIFDYAGDYGNGSYAVWAEDVIYNEAMGKYVMYFCTSSTYIKSNLSYAVADAPEGPYEWKGTLLYSGFTDEDIADTDVYDHVSEEYAAEHYLKLNGEYDNDQWPNCIDPAPFYDEDGRLWMTYGSWSGGIFLLELDPETGLIIHPEADPENNVDPYFGKRLMGGGHKSIEGPYIQYDPQAGYYYLYISYGGLDRAGGYQMRVFRSKTPDGDYVDMNGKYPTEGYNHAYYGLKLSGNYYMPSNKYAYMATGGQSAFIDTDGKHYVCYHTRFDNGSEYHEPCVKQVFINEEGWPVMAPYTTAGEALSPTGYAKDEAAGTYYFINQGMEINADIAEAELIHLEADGSVTGSVEGTWELKEGSCYMKLTYDDVTYSGVFCRMKDEAGAEVMAFTAAGNNQSIWGAKY